MKALILIFTLLLVAGCAQVAPRAIQVDQETHAALLSTANERLKNVSCDVGFVEGLGLTDSLKFPIQSQGELRPVLRSATISVAMAEMKDLTVQAGAWKEDDYIKCKILGVSYRAGTLGSIEILKLIPDLAPWLAMLGPK